MRDSLQLRGNCVLKASIPKKRENVVMSDDYDPRVALEPVDARQIAFKYADQPLYLKAMFNSNAKPTKKSAT